MEQKPKLVVILGPTATGKTALSILLAKKYNGEIISADSRQVYMGLDLGSGKVTEKEMDGVPHHLLDVANPKKQFSVADYVKIAEQKIQEILTKGKIPIVCGGTGLYIDTLLSGVALPEVPANAKLRKQLEKKSAESLFKMLAKLDLARAKTIDSKNPVRLIRAIEIAKALGKVPKIKKVESKYQILKIGLDMPDEILKSRIAIRLDERLKAGMLDEAKRLHAKDITWHRMQELGLEYRAMANFLTNKVSFENFEKNLISDSWHYAKRQRTWFKRDKKIIWINPLKKSEIKKAEIELKKFLK